MEKYTHAYPLRSVFSNITRKEHVLIVLKDVDGKFLLASKPYFYPPGIYRLAGGGVEEGETPEQAVVREFQEELGIVPNEAKLKAVACVTTIGTFENTEYKNRTYLYEYQLDDDEDLTPGDDVVGLQPMTADELRQLVGRFFAMKDDDWYIENGHKVHRWRDYGRMYGFIHQVVVDNHK